MMKSDYDLYSDTYYESLNGTFQDASVVPAPVRSYGSGNTLIRGCLVLLLRAGFVLVQLGSVPIENVYLILLQNIVDIAVSISSFGIIGYILAFGHDTLEGLVGQGMWLVSDTADLDNAVLGFCASIMASGIITMILSGRIHFVGYLATTILFSMIVQPIIMHWVWHDYGWMRQRNFLGHKVSVKDHAGGIVVHLTAGTVGLIGALFLGRRLLKLSDIAESSIGAESPGSTLTGYIFIALGLIGFSLPSPHYEITHIPYNYIGLILINNIMAMSSGIIVMLALQFLFSREPFNYWMILRCMQGAIAGMVSIASGVDVYTPLYTYAIASASTVLFYFVVICMHNTSVEDYCNVTAIHLVCGFVSSITPPMFANSENLGVSVTVHFRIIHLGWQLLSVFTIASILIIIFTSLFFVLFVTGFLRNKSEEVNHLRGITVAVKGPERCFLQRLFTLYTGTPYIEPGKHGKSPEQYYSYQAADFSIDSADATQKYAKKATAQVSESSKIPNTRRAFDTASIKIDETTKKPRFIYTMPNVDSNREATGTQYFDPFRCRGDIFGGHEGEQNIPKPEIENYPIKNVNEACSIAEKRHSCYELHRTRKHTNLFRDRCGLKKRGLKLVPTDVLQTDMPRSPECMAHDNLYNDGFISIKMPCAKTTDDLSNASDS